MVVMQMILRTSQRNGGRYSGACAKTLEHSGCASGSMTSSASPARTCKRASSLNTPRLLDNHSNASPVTWQGQVCWSVPRLAHRSPRSSSRSMGKASPLGSPARSQCTARALHGMDPAPIDSCCSIASRVALTTTVSPPARRSWRWCMARSRHTLGTFSGL